MSNIMQMMAKAQKFKQQMTELQNRMQVTDIDGEAGSGLVKCRMTGKMLTMLKIDSSLANADDMEMLEDLVMVAVNDARAKASELAEKTAENARATAEAAKARIQDGYGRARAATSDLAAKAGEQADAAREAAGQAYEKGKAQAKRANSKLKTAAEKQPLALVAGAVAIGALLGSLLPKSVRRDRADDEE